MRLQVGAFSPLRDANQPLILILRVLKSGAADGLVSRDYATTKEAS